MRRQNPNILQNLFFDMPFHWQMIHWERIALGAILDIDKPEIAIEVGTYKGGSLQIISQKAHKVYSIDISSECKNILSKHFQNVEFITGDSKHVFPQLLKKKSTAKESLGFILIDGDHSTEGVREDIDAVLQYIPIRPVYIVFHDSFHPRCRKGLLAADWNECPYIHYVEIDFIPGTFNPQENDTAKQRSMYGGFALVLMLNEERSQPLFIHQSQKEIFDILYPYSRHYQYKNGMIMKSLQWLRRNISNVSEVRNKNK